MRPITIRGKVGPQAIAEAPAAIDAGGALSAVSSSVITTEPGAQSIIGDTALIVEGEFFRAADAPRKVEESIRRQDGG